jgi:hypothetical protein
MRQSGSTEKEGNERSEEEKEENGREEGVGGKAEKSGK